MVESGRPSTTPFPRDQSAVIVVFMGAPGGGKGTHAKLAAAHLGVPHISSGDSLRDAVKEGTPLGLRVAPYLAGGALVPDEVLLAWANEIIARPECARGFVLDGFPRTLTQAERLAELLGKHGRRIACVVLVDITEDEAVARLTQRISCTTCGAVYNLLTNPPAAVGVCDACGGPLRARGDDKEEIIRKRFREFRALTEPVIDYYRSQGTLFSIRTVGAVDEVAEDVRRGLDGCLREGSRGRAA